MGILTYTKDGILDQQRKDELFINYLESIE